MSAVPCANHPDRTTFVRCGRCDKPLCVDCMVDSPVGKKCRQCARNRTHVDEAAPAQLLRGFTAAAAVAIPAGWLMQQFPTLIILPFIYGYFVGEVALRAGGRSRSTGMQIATGVAALLGCVAGYFLSLSPDVGAIPGVVSGFELTRRAVIPLLVTAVAVASAVARVRFW